jgi:glycosyltransferase involved in cell wall biosynthesis
VRLVYEPGYSKNVSLARIRSHKVFGRSLSVSLNENGPFDLLYCAVPSTDAGLAALGYAQAHSIPLIIDIQDIWPEAFELIFNPPVAGGLAYGLMRRAIGRVYIGADAIVSVSQTYADVAAKYRAAGGAKPTADTAVVYLGTDLARFDSFAESTADIDKPEGELWVAYIGTLGHSYSIEVITDALAVLRGRGAGNIVFKVMGDGPLMLRFKAHAEAAGIRADFTGRLPYPEMVAMLCRSDIAVNPINKGAAQSVINKVGDYAAAGLPVVSTQDNAEYRSLVSEYGIGYNCTPGDAEGVADAIEALAADKDMRSRMGAANRKLAEEHFDRAATYEAIYRLIDDCSYGKAQ